MRLTRTERDALIVFLTVFSLPYIAMVIAPFAASVDPMRGIAYGHAFGVVKQGALLVLVLSGLRRTVRQVPLTVVRQ